MGAKQLVSWHYLHTGRRVHIGGFMPFPCAHTATWAELVVLSLEFLAYSECRQCFKIEMHKL